MKNNRILPVSLLFSLLGALSVGVAAVPPTVPTKSAPVVEKSQQAYVAQMQAVVNSSKAKGALDAIAMQKVFAAAAQANVRPEIIGEMVTVASAAYPDAAPSIASSALAPYKGVPHRLVLWNVMNSAVMANPKPFVTVLPISEVLMKSVDHSKDDQYAGYIKYITARIASATPDNPLNKTNRGESQLGLAVKQNVDNAAGYGVLFLEPEIGLNPFFVFPSPISPAGGESN